MNYLVTMATCNEPPWQDRTEMLARLVNVCRNDLNVERFIWNMAKLKETMFYKVYRDWFTVEHHMGLWAWKPWIILNALIQVNDGDVIAMLDSDLNASDLPTFIALAKEHKGVFIGHGCRNDIWTPGDIFYLMDMDEEQYWATDHVWGAVAFLLKCPETLLFAQDWLACSLSWELQLSQGKYRPNRPGFNTTRWLQGAETNLILKYGFKVLENGRAWAFSHPAVPLPFT